MDIYNIYWRKSAQKELKKISKPFIKRIIYAVENLSINPFPPNCKKYQGIDHTYRIRVGNYRIIYTIFEKNLTIEIIKVGHRKDIYKNIWLCNSI